MTRPPHPVTARILAIAEARGLAGRGIGPLIGKSHAYFGDMLRNGRAPTVEDLYSIAALFGREPADLLAPAPCAGFQEREAEPFAGPADDLAEIARLAKAIAPGARRPEIWRIGPAGAPGFALRGGDLAILDLGRAPREGEIAILTVADPETGEASTLLRRLAGEALIGPDPLAPAPALAATDPRVGLLGPVVASLRPARA